MESNLDSPSNVEAWTHYLKGANDLSLTLRGKPIMPGHELSDLYMKFIEYWSEETR